jgi:hypothetical protein
MARLQNQSVHSAHHEPTDSKFHRESTHAGEYGEHDRNARKWYKPVGNPVL